MIKEKKEKKFMVSEKVSAQTNRSREVHKIDRSQKRYFVDLRGSEEVHKRVIEVLEYVNSKDYGEVVSFRDVVEFAILKLTQKDLDKIRDSSLTAIEKLNRARVEFNKKNNTEFELEEFLLQRLNIT